MKLSRIALAAAAVLSGASLASCSQSQPIGVCDGVPGACLDLYVSYPAGTATGYDLEVTAVYDGKSSKRITSKPGNVSLPNHFRVVPPPGVSSANVTAISIRASTRGELLAAAKVLDPFLSGTEHRTLSVELQKHGGQIFESEPHDYIACIGPNTPTGPRSTRIADLDSDGHNDIIVTCYNDTNIAILYGTPRGPFTRIQPNLVRIGKYAYFSAIMDVDQNGTLDIVTPSYETSVSGTNGLSVLTSAPGRGWVIPKLIASSEVRLLDAVAADFNGDGMLELIINTNEVAVVPPPPSASKLLIFPNNFLADAGKTFSKINLQTVSGSTVSGAYSLATGFLDDDSNADVVISGNSTGNIAVVWGDSLQRSPVVQTYSAGIEPMSVLVADIDNDKRNDIIVSHCNSPSIMLYKNMGNRIFSEPKRIDTGRRSCSAIADDFDRDGKVDLAVWNNGDFTISILRGTGTGEFQPVQTIINGYIAYYGHMSSGDLNNDGMPDIVLSGSASNDLNAVGATVSVHYNQVP